jgi:hypothetical protein
MTTLRVRTTIDTSKIEGAARQVPFALAKAITDVLKSGQAAEIKHMGQSFTIRRKDFARLSVKITGFPNKNKPVGEIAIASPGGRSDIFQKFETGADKFPHGGRTFIAVPRTGSLVKKRKSSIVPDRMRPKALQSSITLRTFVAPFKKDPSKMGIFAVDRAAEARARRTGKKRDSNQARPTLLYTLIDEAPIKDSLEFVRTVTDQVIKDWPDAFAEEFAKAMATRKK